MPEPLFDNEFLKKLEYLELIARRLVFGRQQAARQSIRKGASVEFKDFREYSPGDDPRTVDWSVYARLGTLVIKLFRQEQELDLHVLLDTSGSMCFGEPSKFDQARRIAAALAYIGMADMDSASIIPFGDSLQPGRDRMRGRGRIFELLDFLTKLPSGGGTDIVTAARALVSRVRRPGLIVVVSDFYGLQSAQRAIDQLRFFKHELFVIQVAAPWEFDPPIRGELRLVDSENDAHEDLTVTDGMLRRYKAAFEKLGSDLRSHSLKYSIGHALARTDVPFEDFLLTILQRGGLVA
jgi:uncharacterized protein (DUF58 family)